MVTFGSSPAAPSGAASSGAAPSGAASSGAASSGAAAAPDDAPGSLAPSRRERKKLQTRDALEAAAMRLFLEKGYEDTTVEEIAEAADVAVRTFFRYFRSKQHVLFGDVATDITGRLRAALAARPADEDPIAAVAAAIDSLDLTNEEDRRQVLERLRLVEKMPELGGTYQMVMQELHDAIAEFVAARTAGQPREFRPQLVAGAATAAIKTAVVIFEADPTRSPAEISAEAYALLTVGLHGPHPAPRSG